MAPPSQQPSQQIADEIIVGVVSGLIVPGQQLPSTKALMEQHDVANQTVQNAIQILKDAGLVYTVQGRGTFVRDDIDPADFEGLAAQSGSELFQQILARLSFIGDEITAIKERLDHLEGEA